MQQTLLMLFVGVCCVMIVLTVVFAFTDEGQTTAGQDQFPVYLAPTPTRGG